MKTVIYTDGGCLGNPGPGGYGAVIVTGDSRRELSGGFQLTTNNRMEIYAAIAALESLSTRTQVMLYSDSRYLVDAINKQWVQRWRANNWKRNKKEKALNIDLWKRLLPLLSQHEVEFKWVRGHAGHKENERCDRLAVAAAKRKNLPADNGYTQANPPPQAQLF